MFGEARQIAGLFQLLGTRYAVSGVWKVFTVREICRRRQKPEKTPQNRLFRG
jgi:hypothetical protein